MLFLATAISVQAQNKFNDAQIAAIAVTANQIDVQNGIIAKETTTNKDVINFANSMINDHTSVIQQASDLARKLGVTPQSSSLSKKLNSDAAETQASLRDKWGSDFDKAYIDNEVAYHKAVINAVKAVLIPQAQNAQLKELLQQVLPVLKEHLKHAEMAQQNIGG